MHRHQFILREWGGAARGPWPSLWPTASAQQSRLRRVRAAGQYHRHARAHHQTGRLRPGHERELLVHHVAGFDVGRDEDIGLACDRRLHALIRAASLSTAMSRSSGPSTMPPTICRRSAILASAAASRVACILELTVSIAARTATLGWEMPIARARMIASAQCRASDRDRERCHRGIADDDGARIGRSCEWRPSGSAGGSSADHLALRRACMYLIGVQAPFINAPALPLPARWQRRCRSSASAVATISYGDRSICSLRQSAGSPISPTSSGAIEPPPPRPRRHRAPPGWPLRWASSSSYLIFMSAIAATSVYRLQTTAECLDRSGSSGAHG